MRQRQGLAGLRELPAGAVMSIGNYDGLHLGHRSILAFLRSLGRPVCVVTFEPHPLTVLRPEAVPPRLATPERKAQLLEAAGADELVLLPPSPDVLSMTAEEFWAILRDDVRPAHLVEGANFNFGRGRAGTMAKLQAWAAGSAVKVHLAPTTTCVLSDRTTPEVSSTLVRWLLGHGRVADAAVALGRPYELTGPVVQGFQRGRTIGVPTANLDVAGQLVPADGVYAGRVDVAGVTYAAAVNIGTSPSFEKQRFQIEAHLLDFAGDLYGQTLDLKLTAWLRDSTKFPGIDALKDQIGRDLSTIRADFAREVVC